MRYAEIIAVVLFVMAGAVKGKEVEIREEGGRVRLSNGAVELSFDSKTGTYDVIDQAAGRTCIAHAGMRADSWENRKQNGGKWKFQCKPESADDLIGKGKRLVVEMVCESRVLPVYLFAFTLYENHNGLVMGFGVRNTMPNSIRMMSATPLAAAEYFPGAKIETPLILNGAAGAAEPAVSHDLTRSCPNSMLLTASIDGRRRSIVWGGLANREFAKYVKIQKGTLELSADDPVGRLVDSGSTYWSQDTFYLDVVTDDPFSALETYGLAMRTANCARPNVYDFPTLCGWAVGALSGGPNINNSKALVEELEFARKCGFTKYSKVAVRLEPDFYCYKDGNTEQGWWDNAHWAKFGHLVSPYDTFAKWCAAVKERDGIPFTYFQLGLPSDDYAREYPGHMLFNDISRLQVSHPHHQPLVSFDYTDPGFQKHMKKVWGNLREAGLIGVKFDYPETGWRPEGGFENKYATAAFAYREAFRMCREGLGPEPRIHERNLGESGRPCLDVTIGLVDLQRTWGDSNEFEAKMVTVCGLRWYKNRVVVSYYPDSKAVHMYKPEERRTLLTMIYFVSGRLELATSFRQMTPEMVHDMSRVFPLYTEPRSARPIDAFTGVKDPRIYDLELNSDWHQVAFFNPDRKDEAVVSSSLSGVRADGTLGLDSKSSYYVYEFWSDRLVGKLQGTDKLEAKLGPLHCAVFSVRKVQPVPQVLSTSRHVLQGWLDLSDVKWNAEKKTLTGIAKVVGGESFRIVLAANGSKAVKASAEGAQAVLEAHPAGPDYSALVLNRADNGSVSWQVQYE